MPPRYLKKAKNDPLIPLGEDPPPTAPPKSAVFLNPVNPPHSIHVEWGLGGGIGANV